MTEASPPSKTHQDHLYTLAQTKGFLGREFLTWLWYQAENSGEGHKLPASPGMGALEMSFWIDDRIVMHPLDQTGHEHLMRGGSPSHSAEAATALAGGKVVKEVKLGVRIESLGDFTAILSYHDLNPRSLQLPAAVEDDDGKEAKTPLAIRLYQTQAFLWVLDHLFAQFMQERTAPNWESERLSEIKRWMKRRLAERGPLLH